MQRFLPTRAPRDAFLGVLSGFEAECERSDLALFVRLHPTAEWRSIGPAPTTIHYQNAFAGKRSVW